MSAHERAPEQRLSVMTTTHHDLMSWGAGMYLGHCFLTYAGRELAGAPTTDERSPLAASG